MCVHVFGEGRKKKEEKKKKPHDPQRSICPGRFRGKKKKKKRNIERYAGFSDGEGRLPTRRRQKAITRGCGQWVGYLEIAAGVSHERGRERERPTDRPRGFDMSIERHREQSPGLSRARRHTGMYV